MLAGVCPQLREGGEGSEFRVVFWGRVLNGSFMFLRFKSAAKPLYLVLWKV